MAASRVPATLARLHELWAPLAVPGQLNVWFGPVATADTTDALWVGWDAAVDSEDRMAVASSDWAGLGGRKRNEAIALTCAITVLRGLGSDAGGVLAAMNDAYAHHAAAEDLVRADPSLGQGPPYVAAVNAAELFMHPHDQGLLARLVFTVTVQTRN